MSTTLPEPRARATRPAKYQGQRQGIELLAGIVALMWVIEVVNTIDSNRLDHDGIWARNVPHLWGILTAPFLHASFQHLIANTIPFVLLGLIIALHGAARLALVSAVIILVGGLGTWLIAPAHSITVGASGVVFGYATYLLARGFFDRSALELMTGLVVGVVFGGMLIGSLVPHDHVSWQGHLCGGIAGVLAAYALRRDRVREHPAARPAAE